MLRRPAPIPPPNRYQNLLLDGKRFFEAGDYPTALTIYRSACQIAPASDNQAFAYVCKCLRRIARTHLKQEDYLKVIELIKEMIAVNGNRPNLKGADYKVLAQCHLALGQWEEASQALAQAQILDPSLGPTLQRLAMQIQSEQVNHALQRLYHQD